MGNIMNHLSSLEKEEWQWEMQTLNSSAATAAAGAPRASDGHAGEGDKESHAGMPSVFKMMRACSLEQPACQQVLILLLKIGDRSRRRV